MVGVVLLQEEPLALAGGDGHGPGLEPLEAPHPLLLIAVTAGRTHPGLQAGHSEPPEALTRGQAAHQYPGDSIIKNYSQSSNSYRTTKINNKLN